MYMIYLIETELRNADIYVIYKLVLSCDPQELPIVTSVKSCVMYPAFSKFYLRSVVAARACFVQMRLKVGSRGAGSGRGGHSLRQFAEGDNRNASFLSETCSRSTERHVKHRAT